MRILVLVMLGSVLTLLSALLLVSPGRPRPFLDANGNIIAGSISEKVFIDGGGVRQGLFIKGRDRTHPVLQRFAGRYGPMDVCARDNCGQPFRSAVA